MKGNDARNEGEASERKPVWYDNGMTQRRNDCTTYKTYLMAANPSVPEAFKNPSTSARLGASAKVQTSFRLSDHVSHIGISLKITNSKDQDYEQVARIRLPANAVNEITLDKVSNELSAQLTGETPDEGQKCYAITITINLDHICAEQIFVPNVRKPFEGTRDAILRGDVLILYIVASGVIEYELANLREQFVRDATIRSIVSKWKQPEQEEQSFQMGQMLELADAPKYQDPLAAKYSFFNIEEWATILAYGEAMEVRHVKTQNQEFELLKHKVHFCEIPGSDIEQHQRVLMLLDIPREETAVRYSPGDRITVHMDPEIEDPENEWCGTIVNELPPLTSMAAITAYITRPWDRETNAPKDDRVLPVIPLAMLGDVQTARNTIRKDPGLYVTIKFNHSEIVHRQNLAAIQGLNKIYRGNVTPRPCDAVNKEILLGNRFDLLPRINVYDAVKTLFPNVPDTVKGLDEGQKQAIELATNAPGGVILIYGAAGSGKTKTVIEAIAPFLSDNEINHGIVATSASNDGVDSLATAANKKIEELKNTGSAKGKYVVRLHNFQIEKDITQRMAELALGIPKNARPQLVNDLDPAQLDYVTQLDLAYIIHLHYKRETGGSILGVSDKRVKVLELSLGHRALQLAGLIEGSPKHVDPERFRSFRDHYRQHMKGEKLSPEKTIKFCAQRKDLLAFTIRHAAVICTTLAIACEPFVVRNYGQADRNGTDGATIAIFDDAARIPETDMVAAWYNYPFLRGKFVVGDPNQLSPVAEYRYGNFSQQRTLSLMHRLIALNFPHVILFTQYRMVPRIAAGPNNAGGYPKQILNGPGTDIDTRDIAKRLANFNDKKFGKREALLYLDCPHSKTKRVGITKSRQNEYYVKVALNLLADLLPDFQDAT